MTIKFAVEIQALFWTAVNLAILVSLDVSTFTRVMCWIGIAGWFVVLFLQAINRFYDRALRRSRSAADSETVVGRGHLSDN